MWYMRCMVHRIRFIASTLRNMRIDQFSVWLINRFKKLAFSLFNMSCIHIILLVTTLFLLSSCILTRFRPILTILHLLDRSDSIPFFKFIQVLLFPVPGSILLFLLFFQFVLMLFKLFSLFDILMRHIFQYSMKSFFILWFQNQSSKSAPFACSFSKSNWWINLAAPCDGLIFLFFKIHEHLAGRHVNWLVIEMSGINFYLYCLFLSLFFLGSFWSERYWNSFLGFALFTLESLLVFFVLFGLGVIQFSAYFLIQHFPIDKWFCILILVLPLWLVCWSVMLGFRPLPSYQCLLFEELCSFLYLRGFRGLGCCMVFVVELAFTGFVRFIVPSVIWRIEIIQFWLYLLLTFNEFRLQLIDFIRKPRLWFLFIQYAINLYRDGAVILFQQPLTFISHPLQLFFVSFYSLFFDFNVHQLLFFEILLIIIRFQHSLVVWIFCFDFNSVFGDSLGRFSGVHHHHYS